MIYPPISILTLQFWTPHFFTFGLHTFPFGLHILVGLHA